MKPHRFSIEAAYCVKIWIVISVLVGVASGRALGQSSCDPSHTAENPLVLAEFHVWHGLASHSTAFSGFEPSNDRAYDSRNSDVIKGQIEAAKALGIDGFVINWYGPGELGLANDADRLFMDEATSAVISEAEDAGGFCIAILYDEGALSQSGLAADQYMGQAAEDLDYAEDHYFSSAAYLNLEGKPALFVFPYGNVDPYLDWADLRSSFSDDVFLLTKDPVNDHSVDFDGIYAWVQPDAGGFDALGSEWGKDYLLWFYPEMNTPPYSTKITVGAVWPGFDDSLAPWRKKYRFMSRVGEEVYNQTWALATEYQAEIVMIATWNDFEEGTDIEYGIRMEVDMETTMPEVLMRSSPIEVIWSQTLGELTLQVYTDGGKDPIFNELRLPPVSIALASGQAYEIKLWTGSSDSVSKIVKIRRQDPHPGAVRRGVEGDRRRSCGGCR